ncbi:hypothetical protein [Streptomyces sp. CBMA156]|uniref:hypothetical protein n=1 Tax=Streptomyces sp. CBMA156 TaxID=1930280 RepID=UPI0016621329|nr:hypothetical protein [Streptomyces sp. CBMA156]MBD0675136.1 hypothetical protein [Streptomyces sp. CBMA156]
MIDWSTLHDAYGAAHGRRSTSGLSPARRASVATGEALGGAYFSCPDGLIVRDAGISKMTQVLVGLVEADDFTHILQRIDE